jgi:2-dehydro-3-deoxyglucarate aldolase/4-hydroxy-2-oxoheptanedioate aldolase
MKPNRFREALAEGRAPLGHMIMEFATRGIAKLLEGAGVDFVLVDMEHTGFDAGVIADQMAWFKATPIAPFVRVPQNQYHFLARTMDAGALGVMIGNVETPEAARQIVDAVKYAPLGRRGVGLGTGHNDYVMPDPVRYFEYANANTTIICQIESTTGLSNLEGIAATPGVDVLWVGHFDLSQSMGIPAQFQHPDFLAALRQVVESARRHGKHAGIQPGNIEQAAQWMEIGYDVVSWSSDVAVYRNALNDGVAQLRDRAAKAAVRGA